MDERFKKAAEFHGHICPGLAIGYRVTLGAMERLKSEGAEDEEFVAVAENNSCSIDAIQALAGCTAGKGNLIINNEGKHAYTFFNRRTGNGIRIYADMQKMNKDDERLVELMKKSSLTPEEEAEKQDIRKERIDIILNAPEEDFLRFDKPHFEMPERAMIFNSIKCHSCGEVVMETKIYKSGGSQFCSECFRNL